MDYDSTPLNATFTAGSTSTVVNVPVIRDNISEQIETFDLIFIIPLLLVDKVIPGNITKADGNIIDTSGKRIAQLNLASMCYCIYVVTTVKFSDSTYNVDEDSGRSGFARFLLLLSNPSSIDITFEVFNTNITALGKLFY